MGLGEISDPKLIADTILDVLRVPRSPQREPLEQVVESLAHQPSLLILDNYEHLVEEGAALVQALLSRVPSLKTRHALSGRSSVRTARLLRRTSIPS